MAKINSPFKTKTAAHTYRVGQLVYLRPCPAAGRLATAYTPHDAYAVMPAFTDEMLLIPDKEGVLGIQFKMNVKELCGP